MKVKLRLQRLEFLDEVSPVLASPKFLFDTFNLIIQLHHQGVMEHEAAVAHLLAADLVFEPLGWHWKLCFSTLCLAEFISFHACGEKKRHSMQHQEKAVRVLITSAGIVTS